MNCSWLEEDKIWGKPLLFLQGKKKKIKSATTSTTLRSPYLPYPLWGNNWTTWVHHSNYFVQEPKRKKKGKRRFEHEPTDVWVLLMLGAAGLGEVETVSQRQRVGVHTAASTATVNRGRAVRRGHEAAPSTKADSSKNCAITPVTKVVKRMCQVSLPHMITRCYKQTKCKQ